MTIQRMIELLEIEHECMLRGAHDNCDRNCADCDLVQDDMELHEMYTNVISLLKEKKLVAVYESKISRCACGNTVNRYWHPKFCGYCGRELLWY